MMRTNRRQENMGPTRGLVKLFLGAVACWGLLVASPSQACFVTSATLKVGPNLNEATPNPYVCSVGDTVWFKATCTALGGSYNNIQWQYVFGDGVTSSVYETAYNDTDHDLGEGHQYATAGNFTPRVEVRRKTIQGSWITDSCYVTVVEVGSLVATSGTEVDDGDVDSHTKAYWVLEDSGTVTVAAASNPSVSEGNLPATWTLEVDNTPSAQGKLSADVSTDNPGTVLVICEAGTSQRSVTLHVLAPGGDADGDGVTNAAEASNDTNPFVVDTDGDGLVDGEGGVVRIHNYPQGIDKDGDGFADGEADANTDPTEEHSDNDGMPDGWEYLYDLNPNSNTDGGTANADDDNLTNVQEYEYSQTYHYDFNPQVDNSGDSWSSLEYDSHGDLTCRRDYEFNGSVVALAETHYAYDGLGRRWQEIRMAGPVADYASHGTKSNVNNFVTLTAYNVDGSVQANYQKGVGNNDPDITTQSGDLTTAYSYDGLGRQTQMVDPLGVTTAYEYNAVGQLTKTLRASQQISAAAYDALGRVTQQKDALNNYYTINYNSLHQPIIKVLHESGGTNIQQQWLFYDNLGKLSRDALLASANTNAASYSYTFVSTTADKVTDYATDPATDTHEVYTYSGTDKFTARMIAETSTNTVTKGYATGQPFTREVSELDAAGKVTLQKVYAYDEYHSTTNFPVLTTSFTYDNLGRLYRSIAQGGTNLTTTYNYDGQNRKIAVADPKGLQTSYEYDGLGRMTRKVEDNGGPLDRPTLYVYNRLSQLAYLIGNDGTADQTTAYAYDLLGQETSVTYPDNGAISFAYNSLGKVTQRIDQRGWTTNYTYDNRGQLLTKYKVGDSDSIQERYAYDARGLMILAKKGNSTGGADYDNTSKDEFTYDDRGFLITAKQTLQNGSAKEVDYSRNQLGQATTVTYPSGNTVNFAYTSLDQVSTMTGVNTDYDYAGTHVRQRVTDLPSTSDLYFVPLYDSLGRLTEQQTYQGSPVPLYADYVYQYDVDGNIVSQNLAHRSNAQNAYGYDTLNRLTDANYFTAYNTHTPDENFQYDLLGNRQTLRTNGTASVFYLHDNTNAYTSINSVGVSHDAAGNLSQDQSTYVYAYDYENRLKNITKSTAKASYEYDALGRRIEKIDPVAGTTTRYYYDGWRVLADADQSATIQKEYFYGNYLDEVVGVKDLTESATYCLVHDQLYSPVALICYQATGHTAGDILERYEYDVYGKRHVYNPDFSGERATSNYGLLIAFTGQRLDLLDGGLLPLMYYKNRYYDPLTGRFWQKDPFGIGDGTSLVDFNKGAPAYTNSQSIHELSIQYKAGLSLYEYVTSTPLSKLDPLGLQHFEGPWNPPDNFDPNNQSIPCGKLSMDCKCATHEWPVYGNSRRAKAIIGSGCVTLLFPKKGIYCTGSCEEIKYWRPNGIPILNHEACHACAFEDAWLFGYGFTWIPGDLINYCDKHAVTATPHW